MAKLVIQLGALEDLVSQLKKAAEEGPKNGYSPEMEDEVGEDEGEKKPEFCWMCEQDGTKVYTSTPREYMRCPVDNNEMRKVSEHK
jgi:hypothetical protein